jgi:hypothetical protein
MRSLLPVMTLEKVCHVAPTLGRMLPGSMSWMPTQSMAGTMLPGFCICVCLGGSYGAWGGTGSAGTTCMGACTDQVPRGEGAHAHSVVTGVCGPSGCGGDRPEDLQHFIWECPAYDHIRDRYASLFAFSVTDSAQQCMQRVFGTTQQRQLAHCVAAMDVYRRYLLGKGNMFGVRTALQPVGYVAVMPYPACLRRRESSLPSTVVSAGMCRDSGRGTCGGRPVGSALRASSKSVVLASMNL